MEEIKGVKFDPVVENERRYRIIYSIIVFILLGVFTIVERFVFFYRDNLGLLFGVTFVDSLSPDWFVIAAGITLGVFLIVAGVFMGFQRIWLPSLAVVVLTIDLIFPIINLLNTMVKDSLPLLVILAVRIACLKWLAQGIMAVWQRQQRAKEDQNNQISESDGIIHKPLSKTDIFEQKNDNELEN
ncbi:MAG: hypothetical protein PHQ55_08945 [Eubacteriales bacterium]|nr:hypothetical protein [Eubacteriales bacterium]MDD3198181.1 hypothetical protein [Eubacteriales bacterium]MDD3504461.1 hypothetical protein [Eubacteriales bacterium]MDD4683279.1 hypothetical protein [Eubacteriales bacterium]